MDIAGALHAQHGLLTHSQAIAAGVSRGAIAHRLHSARWQSVAPAIYATFTGKLSTEQHWIAALLYGGPTSLLGGSTAASVHGLRQLPRSPTVHLLLPHRLHRADRAFVRIRRTTRMPAPDLFDDLRAVLVARAVVDTCRELPTLDGVRALVAESVRRGKTTVATLSAELARGGSAGSALIRVALADVAAGAHSAAEAGALNLLVRSSLPPARWNRDLFTLDGAWLARPDAWWPDAGVVLEIDSQEWHLLPAQWSATMARHARMTSFGLLVVHASPRQIRAEPATFLATLARTIAQGQSRPALPVTDVAPSGWGVHR